MTLQLKNNTVQAETLKFGNLLISVDTESKIFALDASTGLLVWQKAIGRQPGRRGFTIDQKRGAFICYGKQETFFTQGINRRAGLGAG
jgi:glucose dehydrogenase